MIEPGPFAERWLTAWNAHDLDAVLRLFHDDVVFTSPLAAKVVPESQGVIHGKPALRNYWTAALAQLPDLHFELTSLFAGVDTLLIGFRMNGARTIRDSAFPGRSRERRSWHLRGRRLTPFRRNIPQFVR